MRVLGRLLQFIGWAWVVAGFIAQLADVEGPPILFGFVLVFVARVIRAQAARNDPEEPADGDQVDAARARVEPVERPLNTERDPRPPPQPIPEPVVRHVEPEPEPFIFEEEPPAEREGLIERIVLAGNDKAKRETTTQRLDSARSASDHNRRSTMSSAEMIAAARKRWDSKPREGR